MTDQRLDRQAIQQIDRDLDASAGPGHPASGLRPGTQSPRGAVCVGHDGYLFIGNGGNAWERQYHGEFPITAQWRQQWTGVFARRRAEAAARGVRLAHLVCPEKQAVLPEKRWTSPPSDGSGRPVRHLLTLASDDDHLLYPAAALSAAHAVAPAVFRHNSHWTASGCLVAADAVLQALGEPAFDAGITFAAQIRNHHQDLTVHLFHPPPTEDMLQLTANGFVIDDDPQHAGRNTGSGYAIRNAAAPDRRTLVIFGDSYVRDAGLGYALSARFGQVVFRWSKDIDWALVERLGAQLVLWESAERFLVTAPAA